MGNLQVEEGRNLLLENLVTPLKHKIHCKKLVSALLPSYSGNRVADKSIIFPDREFSYAF